MALQCARFSSEPDIVLASTNSPPLRRGSHGDGVQVLQLALIDLGFAMPISTKNGASLPDGIFGAETLNAVTAFQRANGLVVDGVAGANTIDRLDKAIAAQSEAMARGDAVSSDKPRGFRNAMAITLDASSAKIAWTTSGATAACHTGSQFALLHCTKGANLTAGDRSPAGKVKLFDAVELEGSVFLEATANEFDIGDRQIGMVQTTELMFYEFVYAGRRDTEGSCNLDLKAGFTVNPSLDVQSGPGQTIDDKIFDFATLLIDRVTTPKTGFNVKVRFGDHPNNVIPYRFQNGLTGARNYLAMAARAQKFNVYLVTRANATAPVEILGRFNWAADWIVEFSWSARTGRPTASTRRVDILEGVFVRGNTPDTSSNIVVARTRPTANKQDEDAVNAIYNRRRAPLLKESRHWPAGFRTDFFT